jgi:FlaG/FlaF family flagellin (archaellin)
MANITTVTGSSAGQTTGARIDDILDTVSWPASMRDINTGDSTVQADPATARTSLNALKNVEFSEQGAVYVSPGGNLVFDERSFIISKSGQNPTTFANDGSGIGYKNIVFAFDDKLIINQASITRTGGTAQTATNAESIAKYFPHSVNYSDLVVQTDAEALNIARTYVATRAETTIRIDALTLDLNTPSYTAGINAALNLDFFDTLAITNVAQDGTIIQKTLQCMGIQHEITPNSFLTTVTTSEPIVDGFLIGSSLYGIIGTSVMTY